MFIIFALLKFELYLLQPMTQKQKNQGNIDLANMLKLFVQENCQSEEADDNMEVTVSEDSIEEEASNTDDTITNEDISEMMGAMMLDPDINFAAICNDPKFKKVLNKTIKGVTEMLAGASKVVKDLPEKGLTVETGLTAVAEAMTKNATRSSSHEFTEYIIHEDKQMAMEIMKKMYDGKSGVKVVWLTLFFIEIGWLTEPSPAAIIDTFNVKKFSKQLYSANKNLSIPAADHKAFSACLENLIDSYKSQNN